MLDRILVPVLVMVVASVPASAADFGKRVLEAKEALVETLRAQDGGVPETLLRDSRCIAVFPGVVKAALGWGGRHGRGVASCRDDKGRWSPPSFLNISGGGVGFQIGVEKTDLVLFIMTEKGARSLVDSEFTLGATGSVAAGPMGRSVEGATDIKFDAEIYSYARSRGLFAGVSLEGARVNTARKAIEGIYGESVDPAKILFGHEVPNLPSEADSFRNALP